MLLLACHETESPALRAGALMLDYLLKTGGPNQVKILHIAASQHAQLLVSGQVYEPMQMRSQADVIGLLDSCLARLSLC